MKARLRAAACAAAMLTPAFAHAEHDKAATETVIVTARRLDEAAVLRDARVRLSETPGGVAVVGEESFRDRFAQTLGDTLRGVPGVFAQRRYGEETRFSIRGSGIGSAVHNRGVLLAQDGVPYNQPDGFGDFQEIDPLAVRYAEVFKGGNALRFGGAALGGAVNFVSPTGRTAGYGARVRAEAGSWDTYRLHGAVAGVAGDWDGWAGVTGLSADGRRAQAQSRALRGAANLGRSFGEGREVRLYVAALDLKQDIPGALPLRTALAASRTVPAVNLANDFSRDMTAARVSVQTRWRLSDDWTFEGGVYRATKQLYHPISIVIDQDSANAGAFGRLDWTGRLGGRPADLFAGAYLRDGDMDALVFTNSGGRRGVKTSDSLQSARGLDAFAEGRVFVTDAVALVAGGTWGRAERDYRDRLVASRSASRDFEWFAPRIGLLWQNAQGDQAFANVTRSVEPPPFGALVQAPNPGFVPVEPQEAWTAEVGARGRRAALAWDVALYRAELDKELLTFVPGPDVPAATFNAGPTIHQGLEAALDWRVHHRPGADTVTLRQVYAWSDFRFDGDRRYGRNRLPVVPKHAYRAELKWERGRWFVAPAVEWTPQDVWVDYANTLKAPGWTAWSLNAGVRLPRGVSLFVDARNLTDAHYVSNFGAVTDARSASTSVFWPGDPRTVLLGVTWSR